MYNHLIFSALWHVKKSTTEKEREGICVSTYMCVSSKTFYGKQLFVGGRKVSLSHMNKISLNAEWEMLSQ